ncbi:MAG: PQQ-binding-like beta-propeller repeat protein [Candidatus Aminicenantes bacterium]|nr:PQQ-binding-like beta-propeller repeat protein [Candidatus Aminicenantes bacterium]
MKKIIFVWFFAGLMVCCALIKPSPAPYPTGIIFPLETEGKIDFQGEIDRSLLRVGDRLFFTTWDGFLYCADGRNRTIFWKKKPPDTLSRPAYASQARVYVCGDKFLYVFDLAGKRLWHLRLPAPLSSGIRENDGKVFFGTENGEMIACDAGEGTLVWRFQAGRACRSNPVPMSNMIVFGCEDHRLYFLDSTNGRLVDTYLAGGAIEAEPCVSGDNIYFGSDDGLFTCVNMKKKQKIWEVKTGSSVIVPPVVWGKRLLFLSWSSILFCVNKNSGIILWWRNIPARSPYRMEIIKDRIVLSSISNQIIAFDIKSGVQVGTYEAEYNVKANPLWMDPFLLLGFYDEQNERGKILYLKKEVKAFLAASKISPQNKDTEIIFTASTHGFFKPEFEFYLTFEGHKEIVLERSEERTWTWYPSQEGKFLVSVKVFDQKQTADAEVPFVIGVAKKSEKKEVIMQRDEALALVKEHLKNKNLIKHCLAVEACMRAVAERLGEDKEKWGLAGILHDLDYEVTEKSPELHTKETVKILEDKGISSDIIHAIQAHAGQVPCENPMDWAIYSIDPLTGLIIAATLMHPSKKLAEMDLGFIKRRYKEKSFARGADRSIIEECRNLGIELDDFISICLKAMQDIHEDLGL